MLFMLTARLCAAESTYSWKDVNTHHESLHCSVTKNEGQFNYDNVAHVHSVNTTQIFLKS